MFRRATREVQLAALPPVIAGRRSRGTLQRTSSGSRVWITHSEDLSVLLARASMTAGSAIGAGLGPEPAGAECARALEAAILAAKNPR